MPGAVSIQLSPALSQRVIRYVEQRRRAFGWSRHQLALKANRRQGAGALLNVNLLDTWASKARAGHVQRIDLEKALVLLAVCGHGSNRVDELAAELGDALTALVDEAVSDAAV